MDPIIPPLYPIIRNPIIPYLNLTWFHIDYIVKIFSNLSFFSDHVIRIIVVFMSVFTVWHRFYSPWECYCCWRPPHWVGWPAKSPLACTNCSKPVLPIYTLPQTGPSSSPCWNVWVLERLHLELSPSPLIMRLVPFLISPFLLNLLCQKWHW